MPEEAAPQPEDLTAAARGLEASLTELDKAGQAGGGFDEMFADLGKAIGEEEPAPAAEPKEPAEAPKEPAEAPEGEIVEPKFKSEVSKANWKKLETAKAEAEARAKEIEKAKEALTAEVEDLRRIAAEAAELREKAKRIDEVEQEFSVYAVERTADFKRTIAQPLDAIEKEATVLANENSVSADRLLDALAEPDMAKRRAVIKELTADMDDIDRSSVLRLAGETQTLLSKRQEIFAQAASAAKEAEANKAARTAEATVKSKREFEAATKHVVEELRKRLPFEALDEGETEDGVYALLRDKIVESGFDDANTHKKAFSAAAAAVLPRLNRQLKAAQEKIKTLEARVADENRRGSSLQSPAEMSGDELPGGGLEEALAKALGVPNQSRDITHLIGKV